MNQRTVDVLFALLRSAVCGKPMTQAEKELFSEELLPEITALAKKHDMAHVLGYALHQNELSSGETGELEMIKAVFRYERLTYELESLCEALEEAGVDFMPLKGSVLRAYYAEPWMRTSCDIDVLVHKVDISKAVAALTEKLQYEEKERGTHDISLFSPAGNHIELHFDLVEEGRANDAINILASVWEYAALMDGTAHRYEMSDDYFYFYHIAHMAKHFSVGGCGIRPFADTWILDRLEKADRQKRDELLAKGELLAFAEAVRKLSRVWFGGETADALSLQLQEFLLHGGVYGSADNRVALQQKKQGGRLGYFFSRVFIPYEKLKRYYPILEKHPWLVPVMQVRRWFMIFRPDVARMAKSELRANRSLDSSKTEEMNDLLGKIGLE